jgi:SAM-dependent methyltransferase
MTPSPAENTARSEDAVEPVLDRLFTAMVDGMDVLACAIGDRLGYYRALDGAALTPGGLAARTGASLRYTREWLEQQAMSGYVVTDGETFLLAPGVAEVLARPGTSAWFAPFLRMFAAAGAQWTRIADGARTGQGLGWADYGPDMFESQSDANAAAFRELLADTWLPASVPELHRRMDSGEPLRVAEVGCGGGWAALALATRFPNVRVDAYDVDPPTIALARAHVDEAGLADQVRVLDQDLAREGPTGAYDLVMAFECIHDMPAPVDVLAGVRRAVKPDGRVLVADMRGAEEFVPDGDPVQRALYGFSLLVCLPDAMTGNPDGATGTVMRPATMDRYARAAGFAGATPLDVEHDFWRFFELRP